MSKKTPKTKKDPKRVASGKKSKRKGNTGERAVAKLLSNWWGSEFTRTPSSGGFATQKFRENWNAIGDVVTPADFPFVVEVKNVKSWNLSDLLTSKVSILTKYWKQVNDEVGDLPKYPMLVFKKNRSEWFVMIDMAVWYDYGLRALNDTYMTIRNDDMDVVVMPWKQFATEINQERIVQERIVGGYSHG